MNETDKKLIEIFSADEPTFKAVYSTVKDNIERKRDFFMRTINERKGLSNEQIGANIRAFDEAVHLVDNAFRELRVTKPSTKSTQNPAR